MSKPVIGFIGLGIMGRPMAKHLLALILEGQSGVCFDNLPEGTTFESNTVAKAMTSELFRGRILGETRTGVGVAGALMMFTGNNILPGGDFASRVLPIYLDARDENPDRRRFGRPRLADWCAENRAEVIRHLATILVGGLRSGATLTSGLGYEYDETRFKEWDRLVRVPLIWAGGSDPAVLFERNKVVDSKLDDAAEFLEALFSVYGEREFLMQDVIGAFGLPVIDFPAFASGKSFLASDDSEPCINGEGANAGRVGTSGGLRDAVTALFPRTNYQNVDARMLGDYARKIKNRVYGNYRLVTVESDARTKRSKKWRVERMPGSSFRREG